MDLLKRSDSKRRRGSSTVELALVLPVLAILLGGVCDFSIGLHDFLVAHNAARTAVRAATLAGGGTCSDAQQRQLAKTAAQAALQSFIRADKTVSPTIGTEPGKDLCKGGMVSASISAKFDFTFLAPFFLADPGFSPSIQIKASATGQNENVDL